MLRHPAHSTRSIYYTADAAAFGFALARLAQVMGGAGKRYHEAAERIAHTMRKRLEDTTGGGFWTHTPDAAASGVFEIDRCAVQASRFGASNALSIGCRNWRCQWW